MAWIESHTQTKRHRKVVAIARELRLKTVWMMGHLHSLWHTVLEQQEDGDLSSWDDDMIAHAAEYSGDATKFVQLLRKHKLLDDANTIHDWLDYAGLYLTRKYAGRYRDRLVTIWAKHNRCYGDIKKPPDHPNGSCNGNQTTIKQEPSSPQDGRLVSSKDSSETEDQKKRPDEPDSSWLFREWLHYLRRKPTSIDGDGPFDELVRLRYSAAEIVTEIRNDERDRSESLFDFTKRFKTNHAPKPKKAPAVSNHNRVKGYIGE